MTTKKAKAGAAQLERLAVLQEARAAALLEAALAYELPYPRLAAKRHTEAERARAAARNYRAGAEARRKKGNP